MIRKQVPEAALGIMIGHTSERITDGYDHRTVLQRLNELEPARVGVERLLE